MSALQSECTVAIRHSSGWVCGRYSSVLVACRASLLSNLQPRQRIVSTPVYTALLSHTPCRPPHATSSCCSHELLQLVYSFTVPGPSTDISLQPRYSDKSTMQRIQRQLHAKVPGALCPPLFAWCPKHSGSWAHSGLGRTDQLLPAWPDGCSQRVCTYRTMSTYHTMR